MKNIKISSFIFILIAIFLIINFIGYKLLYNNIQSNHKKDTRILFHNITDPSANLLSKLIHHYEIEKPALLQKHKIVYDYMNSHDLNVSLDEIYKQINAVNPNKPYNIYITDKNLTIQNSTYKADLGFNLGFAKKSFEKHKFQNIVGCSFPIRAIQTSEFLSYTDTYLKKNGDDRAAVLQLSYTYKNMSKELNNIKNVLKQHPSIQHMNAYSFGQGDFTYDMMIKDDPSYIHGSKELSTIQKRAQALSRKLDDNTLITEHFIKDGIHYQRLYMSTQSPISEDLKIVYTLLVNDDAYYTRLNQLNLFMIFSIILGIIAIFIISKIRTNEIKLSEQDKFVQGAMHEIKTPLSIITLNNELRELEFGKDTYSEEINNALKILHTSYSSMGFIMNKDKLDYVLKKIQLSKIVQERVDFFQSIATSHNRTIISDIHSSSCIEMSYPELVRLIDNNLSNAIKYSHVGSTIKVILDNDTLSFHTQGKRIEDKNRIFQAYVRENTTVGGYGLGLSIVKDITDKYNIDIKLQSDIDHGTTFSYIFKSCVNGESI